MNTPATRDALIVAVSEYQDPKLRRLRSPAVDAAALGDVLRDPQIGDFSVDVLIDPDDRSLRRKLAAFFRHARRPSDLLVVHFSCHGVKDETGELFLATTDTEFDLLSATAIPASWLNEQINRCRSKRIVMLLDCCFSGSFPFGARTRAGEVVDPSSHLEGRGRAVISSSNSMEYAYEGAQLTGKEQPSVFTQAVVQGLQTGEADRDHDHQISIQDLYDYVFDQVRQATPNQTPNMMSTLEGPLYLARSSYEPPVEPAQLEAELMGAISSDLTYIRRGAVEGLATLLQRPDRAVALAARQELERLTHDDSKLVSEAAAEVLAQLIAAEAKNRPPRSVPTSTTREGSGRPSNSDGTPPDVERSATRVTARFVEHVRGRVDLDVILPGNKVHRLEARYGWTSNSSGVRLEGAKVVDLWGEGDVWETWSFVLSDGDHKHKIGYIQKTPILGLRPKITAASLYADGDLIYRFGEAPPESATDHLRL
jgi:hypothetical protein